MPGRNHIFRDKEISSFYWIVIGIPIGAAILGAAQKEWILSVVPLLCAFCFAFFGWPLCAEVTDEGTVIFKGLLRRIIVTPQSLVRVKGAALHDYRAHIIMRTKNGLPIGYRHRKYTEAPLLAKALLEIMEQAPQADISEDALKELQKFVQSKTSAK